MPNAGLVDPPLAEPNTPFVEVLELIIRSGTPPEAFRGERIEMIVIACDGAVRELRKDRPGNATTIFNDVLRMIDVTWGTHET